MFKLTIYLCCDDAFQLEQKMKREGKKKRIRKEKIRTNRHSFDATIGVKNENAKKKKNKKKSWNSEKKTNQNVVG